MKYSDVSRKRLMKISKAIVVGVKQAVYEKSTLWNEKVKVPISLHSTLLSLLSTRPVIALVKGK